MAFLRILLAILSRDGPCAKRDVDAMIEFFNSLLD
jgi:hypothetical protein